MLTIHDIERMIDVALLRTQLDLRNCEPNSQDWHRHQGSVESLKRLAKTIDRAVNKSAKAMG